MSEIYWSQFRNNPQHTGRSAVPSFRNPVLGWQVEIGERDFFDEVIIGRDGTLYIPVEEGCLALDSTTGLEKWLFPASNTCHGIAVDVTGSRVYVRDNDDIHWTVDAKTGEELSSYAAGSSMTYYQTIAPDGIVYFWSDVSNLYALSPDGETRLIFEFSGPLLQDTFGSSAAPAIGSDGTLYAATENGKVYALSSSGVEKWSKIIGATVNGSASIASNGTIHFCTENGVVFALTAFGEIKWTVELNQTIIATPAIGLNDTLYLPSFSNGAVYAISAEGKQEWVFQTKGLVESAATITADGVIYFSSTDGNIYALNPDGSVLWTFQTFAQPSSAPVIGPDGRFYVVAHEELYAVGPQL